MVSYVTYSISYHVTLIVALGSRLNAMQVECGRDTYGSPSLVDCRMLLESFANYVDVDIRIFDEEQLRRDKSGSWPGLVNILGTDHVDSAVQLPRFYTLS